jgi:hypothetical protein
MRAVASSSETSSTFGLIMSHGLVVPSFFLYSSHADIIQLLVSVMVKAANPIFVLDRN